MPEMKSAEQIVEDILNAIARLYAEPHELAYSVAGLDGILYQLHSLLASATDRHDEFVEARMNTFTSDKNAWKKLHTGPEFHAVADEPEKFSDIIAEWRRLDEVFGIAPQFSE